MSEHSDDILQVEVGIEQLVAFGLIENAPRGKNSLVGKGRVCI